MIAIVTLLAAFPLGYILRSRFVASMWYAVAYLWAFVYQTLYLTLDSFNGGTGGAFEPQEFPLGYGLVTLSIFMAGFALVDLGRWVRHRRSRRTAARTGATANQEPGTGVGS